MKNRREWAMNATASDFEKEAQKASRNQPKKVNYFDENKITSPI